MQFDIYKRSSYETTTSNFIMLKLFHDEGVDVKGFEDFMEDVHYDNGNRFRILEEGCNKLFDSANIFSYHDAEANEEYDAIVGEKSHEHIIVLKDASFKKLIESRYEERLRQRLKTIGFQWTEAVVKILPSRDGVVFCIDDYAWALHELCQEVVGLRRDVFRYLLEIDQGDEKGNEVSNHDNRRVA